MAFVPFTQRADNVKEGEFKSAIPLLLEQLQGDQIQVPEEAPVTDIKPVPQTQNAAIQQTPQPRPLGPGQIGGTDMQRFLNAFAERRM